MFYVGYTMVAKCDIEEKATKIIKKIVFGAFGAGIFTVGLYLWAPSSMRNSWNSP
jgi:uncharacterized membrane protein